MNWEMIGGVVILLLICWLGYGAYLMVMDSEKRFQERKRKDKVGKKEIQKGEDV